MAGDITDDLLIVALEAACEATTDAGTHATSTREMDMLNEQWAQSYVGVALNDALRERYDKAKGSYLSFETSVAWLDGYLPDHDKPGPRPGSLTPRQRFDIVVWSKGGKVAGLVELKDTPVLSRYAATADPAKLCGALRRWSALRWGIFLFSLRTSSAGTASEVGKRLSKRRDQALEKIRQQSGGYLRAHRSRQVPGRGSCVLWVAVLFRRP